MDEPNQINEGESLRQSWDCVDHKTLDTYLVSGVEDPRINVQSILNRSLLCDFLLPGRFTQLLDEEIRFGFVMTWLVSLLQQGVDRHLVRDALRNEDRDMCPEFVLDAYRQLQLPSCGYPDYLSAALGDDDLAESSGVSLHSLNTFSRIWGRELAGIPATEISVIEPACGSANDYRFLAAYGFSRLIRYTGFDIAVKNIENARRRFPDVDFQLGDCLDTSWADGQFEVCFVHDLFEHLSLEGLDRALQEVMRVTRCEAWLHFFNVGDLATHSEQTVGSYHWNVLSVRQLVRTLRRSASQVSVVSPAELARTKFDFCHYYNPRACTIIATK